jgi:translation elongation factor EF-4
MRKDVLAKCYGGDISRKKKLLKKQAKGKKADEGHGQSGCASGSVYGCIEAESNKLSCLLLLTIT